MVIDRILQLIEYKGITKGKFYVITGLSNGFLDKVKDVGVSKIELILQKFPDVNPVWLVTGNGDMILKNIEIVSEPSTSYISEEKVINYLVLNEEQLLKNTRFKAWHDNLCAHAVYEYMMSQIREEKLKQANHQLGAGKEGIKN